MQYIYYKEQKKTRNGAAIAGHEDSSNELETQEEDGGLEDRMVRGCSKTLTFRGGAHLWQAAASSRLAQPPVGGA